MPYTAEPTHSPTATALLDTWEQGRGHCAEIQALLLLRLVRPDLDQKQAAAIPLGERDYQLLQLRQKLYGRQLPVVDACPHCGAKVEFTLDVPQLCERHRLSEPEAITTDADWSWRRRLPNTTDLLELRRRNPEDPVAFLFNRCISDLHKDGNAIDNPPDLPSEIRKTLGDRLLGDDPLAEILIDLSCPACQLSWSALMEVSQFLWQELERHARRLVQEVDLLARTYGWTEQTILQLSPQRRATYVALAS